MESISIGFITIRYTDNIAVIFFSATMFRSYVVVRSNTIKPIDLAIDVLMGHRDTDSLYSTNNIMTLANYKNSLEDTQPIVVAS